MTPKLTPSDRTHLQWVLSDPIRYIETFLFIRDMDDRIVSLKLNHAQRQIFQAKQRAAEEGKPKRFIILQARREGVTTLEQAISFWTVAMHENRQVATLAHDKESTEKIFRIANLFYSKLQPEFLRPRRLTAHNKKTLDFPDLNSLFYIGTAGSRGFGRGDTLTRAHWSEVSRSPGDPEEQRDLLAGLTEAARRGHALRPRRSLPRNVPGGEGSEERLDADLLGMVGGQEQPDPTRG